MGVVVRKRRTVPAVARFTWGDGAVFETPAVLDGEGISPLRLVLPDDFAGYPASHQVNQQLHRQLGLLDGADARFGLDLRWASGTLTLAACSIVQTSYGVVDLKACRPPDIVIVVQGETADDCVAA